MKLLSVTVVALLLAANFSCCFAQIPSLTSPRNGKKAPGNREYTTAASPTPAETPSLSDNPKNNNPAWTPTSHENRLTIVTFEKKEGGEDKKQLRVTLGANLIKYDLPEDKLRVIYNPANERYLGLELSDGTYWNFTWPKVQAAVQNSTRYTTRLQSLTSDGLDNYSSLPTPSPAPTPAISAPGETSPSVATGAPPVPLTSTSPPILTATQMADDLNATNPLADVPTYIWRPTEGKKKKFSGVLCTLWIGTNSSGDTIQAWCTDYSVGDEDRALKQLREVNEPMALVPIRELVPPLVFMVYDQLHKSRITPLMIHWGGAKSGSSFEIVNVDNETYSPQLYQIPSSFRKTTLATMDGIIGTD